MDSYVLTFWFIATFLHTYLCWAHGHFAVSSDAGPSRDVLVALYIASACLVPTYSTYLVGTYIHDMMLFLIVVGQTAGTKRDAVELPLDK